MVLDDLQSERATQTISGPEGPTRGAVHPHRQYGAQRNDAEFRCKYMLVFFGYTFCPDVCPIPLAVMSAALEKMGPDGDRIVPISLHRGAAIAIV